MRIIEESIALLAQGGADSPAHGGCPRRSDEGLLLEQSVPGPALELTLHIDSASG